MSNGRYVVEMGSESPEKPMTVVGPVTEAIGERPPFRPMKRLDHDPLVEEQQSQLRQQRRNYSLSARALFATLDVVYGRDRDLSTPTSWTRTPSGKRGASKSQFEADFGSYDSLADMFRQIGYDEVIHRQESEVMMTKPRYH